jgi:DNA uptake protein ComE-like DNA-binding protein
MSESSWFNQIPKWIKISWVPIIGGGAIAYAGFVIKNNIWIGLGIGFVGISAIAALLFGFRVEVLVAMYIGQVVAGLMFKQEFLVKTYPRHLPLPKDLKLFQAVAAARPKIEINTCSKDDLVNRLGMPIVYANDILALREDGYIFTYPEELTEILGIPPAAVQKITPFLTFSYYQEQELSWQRVNHLQIEDMVNIGLEVKVAKAIAQERELNGNYRSLMDIKNRTGLVFSSYRQLC